MKFRKTHIDYKHHNEYYLVFFDNFSAVCEYTEDGLLYHIPESCSNLPDIPLIKKQSVSLIDTDYIGFQNTRQFENRNNSKKTVGFFIPDAKFEYICNKPWLYTKWLQQYKQIFSPDLSCYTDFPLLDQWLNTYINRLIGAFWQFCGLIVIPTITWSVEDSYPFCFSGVEKNSIVAVSTIGTKNSQNLFLQGFIEMCHKINPEIVLCYCKPYSEMYKYSEIIYIEHEGRRAFRDARRRPIPGQISLFVNSENSHNSHNVLQQP